MRACVRPTPASVHLLIIVCNNKLRSGEVSECCSSMTNECRLMAQTLK